jgi:membrane-bound serine protease (ClpP class)
VRAHRRAAVTGTSGMIGRTGVARTPLAPAGMVFIHGELWEATASETVETGGRVRVVSVDGLRLRVEPLRES